ncbi:MAG: hypothetical protein H5U21_02535, partial [Porphyrobacter sp.]|nr:hypothetical protein [Porphyrobacter sp.]
LNPPANQPGARSKHGSLLSGNLCPSRVNSQRKSTIHAVRWSQAAYSLADTPVWYDRALELIRALAEAALACEAAQGRVAALGEALKRAVQRVNLLEQVLIPRARRDITRIGIFLADNERTALARAKLAAARRGRPVAVEQSA